MNCGTCLGMFCHNSIQYCTGKMIFGHRVNKIKVILFPDFFSLPGIYVMTKKFATISATFFFYLSLVIGVDSLASEIKENILNGLAQTT